jgi:hypothetical protein
MAGTAYIRMGCELVDLGNIQPDTKLFTITGVDEYSNDYMELAATTAVTVDVGTVDTVNGFFIYLDSGGTTAATGLSVDLLNATWTAGHDVLLNNECRFFRPTGTTFSVKNLNSSTAKFYYLVFGDNA